jgi:hypothetical protein
LTSPPAGADLSIQVCDLEDTTADGSCSYTWDAEGRLASVDGVAGEACQSTWMAYFVYNALGQRVKKDKGELYWYGLGGENH